jgi:hypothetical protein
MLVSVRDDAYAAGVHKFACRAVASIQVGFDLKVFGFKQFGLTVFL